MGEVCKGELVAGEVLALAQPVLIHIEDFGQCLLTLDKRRLVQTEGWCTCGRIKGQVEDQFKAWRVETVLLCLQPLLDGASLKEVSS